MRAVNLLPNDANRQRSITEQNLPAVVGAGMGFLVVAALAAGYLSASSRVAAAQTTLDVAKAQLAKTPLPPQQVSVPDTTPPAISAEQAPRLQAVSTALGQRIAWDRILREFSLVLPNDVWIASLTMNAPQSAADQSGFTISGSTYSYDSVARLLTRVSLVPDLTNVTLDPMTRSGRLVQFGLKAGIKGGVVAPPPAPTPAPAPTDTTSTDTGATS